MLNGTVGLQGPAMDHLGRLAAPLLAGVVLVAGDCMQLGEQRLLLAWVLLLSSDTRAGEVLAIQAGLTAGLFLTGAAWLTAR